MKRLYIFILITSSILGCQSRSDQNIINGIAEVNGTKLYFEAAGDGEVIVLVHGNEGDRRHWDYQFLTLAKDFKVIRYDVRGYGKSAFPDPEIAYSNYEDLNALLDYLKIPEAHICGLSMGSAIVVDFAIAYPEKCTSLIAIGPWVGGYGVNDFKSPATDSLFQVMRTVSAIAKDKGPKEATDYFWTGNKVFRNAVRSSNALDHLKMVGYDYSFWGFMNASKIKPLQPPAITELSKIQLPTLVVTAEYDLEACIEVAKILDKEIRDSKLVSIKDAGHCMNLDKPEEFNRILVNFINDIK